MRRDLDRAAALGKAGALDRAEPRLRAVPGRDPRQPEASRPLAIDRCDDAAVRSWLEAALEARKPDLDALLDLAVGLNRAGRYELSRRCAEAVPEHSGWLAL